MNSEIEIGEFTVPLALEAHSRAEQLRHYQSSPEKAKQVYLNSLAVYAVNFYLECRGFETNLERSGSGNPVMQMLMNVADLVVKNRGKLECRPVLPNAVTMHVPAEVWNDRIGYVAVQLNESLREATVLGFVDKVRRSEFPLSQLRSLAEFPAYLNQFSPVVQLSKWFENFFEVGWQAVESLINVEDTELALAFNFRSSPEVTRCKLIELGNPEQAVVLMVAINQEYQQEMDISIEVQPPKDQTCLPANLQLMVLDEAGETVIDARAKNDNPRIQLTLSGESGEGFSVKLVLGDVSVTENFLI